MTNYVLILSISLLFLKPQQIGSIPITSCSNTVTTSELLCRGRCTSLNTDTSDCVANCCIGEQFNCPLSNCSNLPEKPEDIFMIWKDNSIHVMYPGADNSEGSSLCEEMRQRSNVSIITTGNSTWLLVLGKDNVLDVSIDDKCPEVSLQLVNECGASETVQLQYRVRDMLPFKQTGISSAGLDPNITIEWKEVSELLNTSVEAKLIGIQDRTNTLERCKSNISETFSIPGGLQIYNYIGVRDIWLCRYSFTISMNYTLSCGLTGEEVNPLFQQPVRIDLPYDLTIEVYSGNMVYVPEKGNYTLVLEAGMPQIYEAYTFIHTISVFKAIPVLHIFLPGDSIKSYMANGSINYTLIVEDLAPTEEEYRFFVLASVEPSIGTRHFFRIKKTEIGPYNASFVCPSQVQNISVTQIEKGLSINWTEPLETNGLTGYQLEITANTELINKNVPGGITSYLLTFNEIETVTGDDFKVSNSHVIVKITSLNNFKQCMESTEFRQDVQIQFLERNVYVQNGTDTVELGLNTNIRLDFNVTIDCNSERIFNSTEIEVAVIIREISFLDPEIQQFLLSITDFAANPSSINCCIKNVSVSHRIRIGERECVTIQLIEIPINVVFEPEEILVNESGLAILTLQNQNSNVRRFNVSVECGMTPFISKGESNFVESFTFNGGESETRMLDFSSYIESLPTFECYLLQNATLYLTIQGYDGRLVSNHSKLTIKFVIPVNNNDSILEMNTIILPLAISISVLVLICLLATLIIAISVYRIKLKSIRKDLRSPKGTYSITMQNGVEVVI